MATPASSPSPMTTLPSEGKSFSSPPLSTVTPSTQTSMLDMEPFSTSRYNISARPTTLATSTSLPPIMPENMTETGIVSAMEHGGLSRAEMAGIAGVVIGTVHYFSTEILLLT